MSREDAETLYKELLAKLAKQHSEGNDVGMQSTLKEIEKVRTRLLHLDIAEAINSYQREHENTIKVQK